MACNSHIVDCLNNNVKVEASSDIYWENSYHPPEKALIYSTNSYFATANQLGQWWQIDFKKIVVISSYKIGTPGTCSYVSNWTISLSMNNRTFIKVDEHSGSFPIGVYQISKLINTRYLRVHGTSSANCDTNKNVLAFSYIMFYGTLTPINKATCYCKRRESNQLQIAIMIFILSS